MGHSLIGRSSICLEGFNGLITIADPTCVPENASPRCWDIDFSVGGFRQRDGLYTAIETYLPTTFLYTKTFQQPNGQINTLAMGDTGTLWSENVSSDPGILAPVLSSVAPGSYMFSATASDREYMCYSNIEDPSIEGDIPRQWPGPDNSYFDRVSQEGPGIAPSFQATLTSGATVSITSWAISGNVVTFQAVNAFVVGEIITISQLTTGAFMNGLTFTVLGTGLTTAQFEVTFVHGTASASEAGIATPQYSYPILSITQPTIQSLGGQEILWSAGPGSLNTGSVFTFYYKKTSDGGPDQVLVDQFNSGYGCYVTVAGCPFGNGTWQVE